MIDKNLEIVQEISNLPITSIWLARNKKGIPQISANKVPDAIYPAITLWELDNYHSAFADDIPTASYMSFQVSMFSLDGSHIESAKEIDDYFVDKGFRRNSGGVEFDDTTKLIHRYMTYEINLQEEI